MASGAALAGAHVRAGAAGAAGAALAVGAVLGRGRARARADRLQLDDAEVSRRHARLERDAAGRWWVADLGSLNGTTHNGRELPRSGRAGPLRAGDRLRLGASELVLAPCGCDECAAAPHHEAGPAPADDGPPKTCPLCARDLAALPILEREMHLNGCLDTAQGETLARRLLRADLGGTAMDQLAEPATPPGRPRPSDSPSSSRSATSAASSGRKRPRLPQAADRDATDVSAAAAARKPAVHAQIVCMVCLLDLAPFTLAERTMHLNACLDSPVKGRRPQQSPAMPRRNSASAVAASTTPQPAASSQKRARQLLLAEPPLPSSIRLAERRLKVLDERIAQLARYRQQLADFVARAKQFGEAVAASDVSDAGVVQALAGSMLAQRPQTPEASAEQANEESAARSEVVDGAALPQPAPGPADEVLVLTATSTLTDPLRSLLPAFASSSSVASGKTDTSELALAKSSKQQHRVSSSPGSGGESDGDDSASSDSDIECLGELTHTRRPMSQCDSPISVRSVSPLAPASATAASADRAAITGRVGQATGPAQQEEDTAQEPPKVDSTRIASVLSSSSCSSSTSPNLLRSEEPLTSVASELQPTPTAASPETKADSPPPMPSGRSRDAASDRRSLWSITCDTSEQLVASPSRFRTSLLGKAASPGSASSSDRESVSPGVSMPAFTELSDSDLRQRLAEYGMKDGTRSYMVEELERVWRLTHPNAPQPVSGHAPASSRPAVIRTAQEIEQELNTAICVAIAKTLRNEHLYEAILMHKCLNLVTIQQALRESGVEVPHKKLMRFLDSHGVSYRA